MKQQKNQLANLARGGGGGESALSLPSRKKKRFELEEIGPPPLFGQGAASAGNVREDQGAYDSAAARIREALITDEGTQVMGRGVCLITDSLVDETIKALADELKLCLDLKKQLRISRKISESNSGEGEGARVGQGMISMGQFMAEAASADPSHMEAGQDKANAKAPIATKFSKLQTGEM